MDVGSATSSALSSYQATLQGSGQSAAVLQALTQAYQSASSNATASDTDPLAALAGSSAIGALTVGINAVSQSIQAANGTSGQGSGLSSLSFPATFGGMDTSSVASLLASSGTSSDTSGLQGFGSAMAGAASLAATAYQAQQEYGTGNLTSDAASSTSSTSTSGTTTGTTTSQTSSSDPVTAAYLQAIAQSNLATSLNLLA
jgi:hypothetical protein